MLKYQQAFTIEHPLARVYACWISENTLLAPVRSLKIDARVGGIYQLVMPEGMIMKGEFSRVVPLQRLDYSWQWQGADEIRLRHSGFTSRRSLQDHSRGWQDYIEAMRDFLSHHR